MRTDIIGYLGHVRVVQGRIYFIQDEERRWLIAMKIVYVSGDDDWVDS